ncbi:MAG: TIGR00300 family protein [Dehalococcoidia bacterium]|nr:TIGR00300 family protein [Dehalococcoidia bacterium]
MAHETLGEPQEEALLAKVVEIRGHIIDSLILPRILDEVMDLGGEFTIQAIEVGRHKHEPSYARLEIRASAQEALSGILKRIERLGATALEEEDAETERAPGDGTFPPDFYSTTSLDTEVRLDGRWVSVQSPEMDCGILVGPDGTFASCVPINDGKKGDLIVTGHRGIKVLPVERPRTPSLAFTFMGSAISPEKPKGILVADIAEKMRALRKEGKNILVVAGPAVVHTGAGVHLAKIIEMGYVQGLFAGNALAAHDIEWAFYGTSLGVSLDRGEPLEGGHQHHLRAINNIRLAGGMQEAVRKGVLTKGIMHTCITKGVPFILAGSLRDDGPLPEVITDAIKAQEAMRRFIHKGVDLCLMVSTMLHSIGTSNLLPGHVPVVCVDINPAVATKLMDRGGIQVLGLVMDVGSFLRELELHLS